MRRTKGLAQCAECRGDEREPAREHALYHGLHARVVLLLRAAVAPEDEDVGGIECGIAEALIKVIEPRGLHHEAGQFLQMRRDGFAEEFFAVSLLLLRLLLVPDEDADVFGGQGGSEGEEEEGEKQEGLHVEVMRGEGGDFNLKDAAFLGALHEIHRA